MSKSRSHALQVLLVDDDDSLRRALVRSIRRSGFAVEAFASVGALLERGLPEADVCLVLDVDLQGVSGIELKQSLVECGHDLPTIFITALDPEIVAERLEALTPLAVLYKPFDTERLLAAISRGVERP